MTLYALDGVRPDVSADAGFVAPDAVLIGKVVLRAGASVWFGAVIRGDNDLIEIGEGSNIQDHAVLHTDPGLELRVGRHVTVGHRAVLHGCTIGDCTLIGMGAVVLNRAVVGSNCVIGAGALVTERTQIPDNSLVVGAPARVVRDRTPDTKADLVELAARYTTNSTRYGRKLSRI